MVLDRVTASEYRRPGLGKTREETLLSDHQEQLLKLAMIEEVSTSSSLIL